MARNRLTDVGAWLAALFIAASTATAQASRSIVVTVQVVRDTVPIEGVIVRAGAIGLLTDARGIAALRLPPGDHQIVTAKIGFLPDTQTVRLRAGLDTLIQISMAEQPAQLSNIVVSATRSGQRIEDEPLRVELLAQEEVEEKLLMTPGDITMMLNESAGLRVQTTSPSLGSAYVRVQGLSGRYTQILADGLPLYGGQTGGLGLLQIPPMDLAGVEVIKGVASALYGGSALGGVITLISRRPGEEDARELLVNQTTLGGTDAVGFVAEQMSEQWGYTMLLGGHRHAQVDRDDDGWTDLPEYERAVIRPRMFWSSPSGHSLMVTAGTTIESRDGGTMDGVVLPGPGTFPERLRTNRYDAGLVSGFRIGEGAILSVRGAGSVQRHQHTFGDRRERDEHLTWLGETSLTLPQGRSLWVFGAAVQEERYRAKDVEDFDYTFTTPGLFAQNTLTLGPFFSVTASARVDDHSEYGIQFAPRLSALARLGAVWTLRLSGGAGYSAPTPFTEETEVIGLTSLLPLQGITEERARSASIDFGGMLGSTELNVTAFGSEVVHPIDLVGVVDGPELQLTNLVNPTRTAGAELLLRWHGEPFHVSGSYTFIRSTEHNYATGGRRDVALTPRHQAGLVTMWESEDVARVGVELYYTGVQALEDVTYRSESKPYVHLGVLAERRFGAARVFVNGENLLGFRQTNYDPLLRQSPGPGERWTTDVWGPLEGRVVNVGVRLGIP